MGMACDAVLRTRGFFITCCVVWNRGRLGCFHYVEVSCTLEGLGAEGFGARRS